MVTFKTVESDIKQNESDLLALKKIELASLKQALFLMDEKNWDGLSFNIVMKKELAELTGIYNFDFSTVLSEKYINAIKAIIKSGFETEIKNRNTQLTQLQDLFK